MERGYLCGEEEHYGEVGYCSPTSILISQRWKPEFRVESQNQRQMPESGVNCSYPEALKPRCCCDQIMEKYTHATSLQKREQPVAGCVILRGCMSGSCSNCHCHWLIYPNSGMAFFCSRPCRPIMTTLLLALNSNTTVTHDNTDHHGKPPQFLYVWYGKKHGASAASY